MECKRQAEQVGSELDHRRHGAYAERIPPTADSSSAIPVVDDPNQPGVLLGIVERCKSSQIAAGRDIDTVMIGAFTDEPGQYFAQVTFHGSDWTEDRPGQDD